MSAAGLSLMVRASVPSPFLSILVVAVLLLAAMPMSASAQFGGSNPQDEPLFADALTPVEVLSDPEGDTELMGNTPFPTDAGGANDYESTADIVSLSVSENQDFLVFGLKHRAYPDASATASDVVLFQSLECAIEFHVNGDDRFYEIDLYSENFFDGGDYAAWGWLYVHEQDPEDPEDFEREDVDYLWAAMVGYDHFEIAVPKKVLDADGSGRALRIGDALTDMRVECTRALTLLVSYYDEAGGEAVPSTPYKVSAATRSGELEIGFPEDEDGGVAALTVGPEGPTKLSVIVKNLRDRKLLVNVTAALVDTSGQPLADWQVKAPPTFDLKGNQSLPASIIITPPAGVQHRDGGYLTVRATALGFEDHVQVTRWVSAVVSPGPERNTLYFHDLPYDYYWCSFICTGSDNGLPQLSQGADQFVMNVLPVDDRLGETDTANEGIAMFSTDLTLVYLDAPLGEALRVDPEGVFELTMSLRTDVEREVRLYGYLWAGEEALGTFQLEETIGTTFGTHTVQFVPNADMLQVPAGTSIALQVHMQEGGPLPFSFTGSTWVDSIDWRPAESSLKMPLVAAPKKVVNITDGRALPTLALSNDTDAEEYLNPGATQAFDMFLVNEGFDPDVVGLKADVAEGWTVAFHPGDQFELKPGASAPLCVSITSPDDVLDSESVIVNLTAWSRSDPDVRTTTSLTLIVVDQVDIEERTCTEREQDEYVRPFTERERATPGAPLAGLLGVLALLGVALRRRL